MITMGYLIREFQKRNSSFFSRRRANEHSSTKSTLKLFAWDCLGAHEALHSGCPDILTMAWHAAGLPLHSLQASDVWSIKSSMISSLRTMRIAGHPGDRACRDPTTRRQ